MNPHREASRLSADRSRRHFCAPARTTRQDQRGSSGARSHLRAPPTRRVGLGLDRAASSHHRRRGEPPPIRAPRSAFTRLSLTLCRSTYTKATPRRDAEDCHATKLDVPCAKTLEPLEPHVPWDEGCARVGARTATPPPAIPRAAARHVSSRSEFHKNLHPSKRGSPTRLAMTISDTGFSSPRSARFSDISRLQRRSTSSRAPKVLQRRISGWTFRGYEIVDDMPNLLDFEVEHGLISERHVYNERCMRRVRRLPRDRARTSRWLLRFFVPITSEGRVRRFWSRTVRHCSSYETDCSSNGER